MPSCHPAIMPSCSQLPSFASHSSDPADPHHFPSLYTTHHPRSASPSYSSQSHLSPTRTSPIHVPQSTSPNPRVTEAAASFALGGVEASFLELGCMGCPLDSAKSTCRASYHLCNQRDMYSGGLMVARSMGWAALMTIEPKLLPNASQPADDPSNPNRPTHRNP